MRRGNPLSADRVDRRASLAMTLAPVEGRSPYFTLSALSTIWFTRPYSLASSADIQ